MIDERSCYHRVVKSRVLYIILIYEVFRHARDEIAKLLNVTRSNHEILRKYDDVFWEFNVDVK